MTHSGLLLEIDGLSGNSRSPGYEGWMDVCWFSFGGAGTFGQTRPGTLASITMPVSRVSTHLQLACLQRERFEGATLIARDPARNGELIRGRMKNVRITEFQFRGYSGEMPIHSLELTYEKIEIKEGTTPATPDPIRVVTARAKTSPAPTRRATSAKPTRVRSAK